MKITIIGAGAIGGLIGARLMQAGEDVSVLARGATMAAIKAEGLLLTEADPAAPAGASAVTSRYQPKVSDRAADLGQTDLIVLSVKYTAVASVVEQIRPLLGPETIVLSAMNGIPWWFGADLSSDVPLSFDAVDPGGAISACVPASRVLGCVVHLAASRNGPGHIVRNMGNRLILGESNGTTSARLEAVAAMLREARFEIEQSEHIHHDIWYKLWGNMTMNPISAVTGARMDQILGDPLLRTYACAIMEEAQAVGERIGLPIAETPEERNRVAEKLGPFKTSMLQDVEAGRALEIDALLTVVHDMAAQLKVPTPHLDALLGMARVFAKAHKLGV